jgi:hypothetical protein
LAHAGIGNHLGHLNDVRWQNAMATVMLERRIPTVLDSESSSRLRKRRADAQDSDVDSTRMQTRYVTASNFHGTAKCCIFNSLLVANPIDGERGFPMCRFNLTQLGNIRGRL